MHASKLVRYLQTFKLPIIAGLLIGTSYIPFFPWALFFCLSPLFLFWKRTDSPSQAFWAGWLTQFILNLIGFHWIAYTAVEFGHFPKWFGAIVLLAFASLAHLHYPLTGWFTKHLQRYFKLSDGIAFVVMALIFNLCEIATPMIFPWHLGYPWLWAHLPGAQVADIIGFDGLNTITVLCNALFAWALFSWKNQRQQAAWVATSAVVLIATVNLAGIGRADFWKKNDAETTVTIIQGNIGNFDKLIAERGRAYRDPIIKKYIDLSQRALLQYPKTEILVWPETAFPSLLDQASHSDKHARSVLDFAIKNRIKMLVGSYSSDNIQSDNIYNGLFYVDENGKTPLLPYRKSRLLVFGETFPFSEYIPYMDKLFPEMGAFNRGGGPQIMKIPLSGEALNSTGAPTTPAAPTAPAIGGTAPGDTAFASGDRVLRLGPQICYEGLYPDFSAELAQRGAQVLINVTNDSWFSTPFGTAFEPLQHLSMTAARAVEFRRPLIRSTNTGISTVVLATGELMPQSPLFREWIGTFKIPYLNNPPATTYEKIQGWRVWLLLGTLGILMSLSWFLSRKKRTHEQ
jgi:apolipoprotein N-acyltransferase